ncbi:MAG: carbon-nitrogen hydrolase family protein [Pseudomonadota bacterium]
MTGAFLAACVQFTAGRDIGPNIAAASALIRQARAQGADFILTPETTDMLEPDRALQAIKLKSEENHEGVAAFGALAAELSCWLLIGSLLVRQEGGKPANRSYLFDPEGRVVARYNKIHMFDVDIPDGQSYRESSVYQAGERAVLATLPWGGLGLTICYDLRFPKLYRSLACSGALFLTAPSAFTRFTGQAHWHSLIRARAIETGSYMFAPAQCGDHAEGRQTFGHSLIVDPWGRVLADGGTEPGIVLADIDPELARHARKMIPALTGARDFRGPA